MKTPDEVFEQTARAATKIIAGPILAAGLIGGLVGATVVLLFAPGSGEKTRAEIRQKAIELQQRATETAREAASQAKSKAEEIKINVRDRTAEMKQRSQELVNE